MTRAAPASRHPVPDTGFSAWIRGAADDLDTGAQDAAHLLPRLAAAGFAAAGVPTARGGAGGDVIDGIVAIAEVAQESLAAAFVLWGHRTYIEYLLQSPNTALGDAALPALLSGDLAGATGLSNAMKHLAGLEGLQVHAAADGNDLLLTGSLPWVTNLRPQGFHVAAAVDHADGSTFVAALAHDDAGLVRSPDLSLMGMRATNTAALSIAGVRIGADRILHPNAREWLPKVRPAFVGLQCGMSIGLARRSLAEAGDQCGAGRSVLGAPIASVTQRLDAAEDALFAGVRSRAFEAKAAPLFELRILLAELVAEAVALELQAAGGKAYLTGSGDGFARRAREAAFIPVITPSLVQLKTALQKLRESAA